jgi:hypothetical protein
MFLSRLEHGHAAGVELARAFSVAAVLGPDIVLKEKL